MKIKISILIVLCISINGLVFSQAPNSFKYQSMLRKIDGSALANQNISVRISILQGSLTGPSVYTETQSAKTNSFGISNLNIGEGTVQSGSFANIDWSAGSYYVKIEIDETGGTNYTLSNANQLLSVPFALYAGKAGNGFSGNYNDLTNKPDFTKVDSLLSRLASLETKINGLSIDDDRKSILDYFTYLSNAPFKGSMVGQNCFHGTEICDGSGLNGYSNLIVELYNRTGKWVSMAGVDYEFSKLFTADELYQTNKVLINHWKKGGLITINFTPHNPWINDESDLVGNPGSWNGPGNAQDKTGVTNLNDLLDNHSLVNKAWYRKLDRIAAGLKMLKDSGVIVLFRPMQEPNGNWFWWGMQSHPSDSTPYINVFRHMHDYFTNVKKLNNLIWIYSPNDSQGEKNNSTWNRTVDWAYPGDKYVDIVAGTVYSDSLKIVDYDTYLKFGKPLGIAEYGPSIGGPLASTGTLDTRNYINRIRTDYPRIGYWVCWHHYQGQSWSIISNQHYNELMNDPDVITLDKLNWKK
jgi:mannan endo-1,4-beta-mannosidase